MIKPILFFSVLHFFQLTAMGQPNEELISSVKDSSSDEEGKQTLAISNSHVDQGQEFDYDRDSGIDKSMDPEKIFERLECYLDDPGHDKYVASISVDRLFRPGRKIDVRDGGPGLIFIGVKKPYYNLSGCPRINGKVDIRFEGPLFGMENTGIITFVYDLKSVKPYNQLSSAISVDRVSYTIIMPFGKK